MRRLTGPIRPYDWGSHQVIAAVQGRPTPTQEPEAELWLGAHPADPATVDGQGLDALIAADPEGELGAAVVRRYGSRLPFLLKLLAADRPLSLQVHPNSVQALAGFEAEEAAGVPMDAAERRYKDASHKPELLVAIMDTDALAGFAETAQTADFLEKLGWKPALAWVPRLREGQLESVVTEMLGLRDADALSYGELVEACHAEGSPRAYTIAELADRYPGDPGVLVALTLNYVRLSADEGIYLAAGSPHAYVRGAGMEIMAASDNVLRGGLTSKYVDVDELLRIMDFTAEPPPYVLPDAVGRTASRWDTPTAEFALSEVDPTPAPVVLPGTGGPRVLFCLQGEATVSNGIDELTLRSGESAWSPASDPELTATSSDTARLFVATVADA
ncbi:mannose-6-phosphate isomerase, class I [Fodinicola feengrottensis]|uniref:mannose-6-phosphate isomerase n=1 Tax=Fodinicola feengrottensis TaxID=435914 RepID=A0ABN2GFJ3_9ACTN